ncbi:hypothetical protein [Serratia sp. D1N4]
MDIALCTQDSKEWEIEAFCRLPEAQLQAMRRSLICTECLGNAWYRKSSYGNNSPHFCAHHEENCSFSTCYEVVGEGDGGDGVPASDPDSGIVLNLDQEKNYHIDVKAFDSSVRDSTGQQRSGQQVINGGGVKFPAHLTLKNVLYKLVRSHSPYFSEQEIIVRDENFKDLPKKANELFVEFKSVMPWLDRHKRIFWGFISDARQTRDGKIWLNAGNIKSGLSISINPEINKEFKEYFKIDDSLDSLAGCHALILGTCYYAGSGKPIIWCSNINYIVLRRYNFINN